MLEYIGLILILLILIVAIRINNPKKHPHKCDESCRYFGRNITQTPCMYCEDGSEWRKSDMEGQEWD